MSLLSRDPAGQNPPAHSYPISRGFALVILLALIGLVVLRHLFGSVRLEVGTR
jgi:hypothetical protein